MATREMTETPGFPVFEELLKPWNDWADKANVFARPITIPPVNISGNEERYVLSLAVSGTKREDLKITLEGSILCISSQKEEIEERFTLKEFSFYSFTRSFTLPEDVKPDLIEAKYEDGLLRIVLPRKEKVKPTTATTQIAVH